MSAEATERLDRLRAFVDRLDDAQWRRNAIDDIDWLAEWVGDAEYTCESNTQRWKSWEAAYHRLNDQISRVEGVAKRVRGDISREMAALREMKRELDKELKNHER